LLHFEATAKDFVHQSLATTVIFHMPLKARAKHLLWLVMSYDLSLMAMLSGLLWQFSSLQTFYLYLFYIS